MRFHHMLRTLKVSSPMSLGVWLSSGLAIFGFFAAVISTLVLRGNFMLLAPLRWVAIAGLPFALGVALYKGVLLSTTAQPLWSRMRWLGALLSLSSGTCGLTIMLALAAFVGDDSGARSLRFASGVLLALYSVALVVEMAPLMRAFTSRSAAATIAAGSVLALVVGGAIPAALALLPDYFPHPEYLIMAATLAGALSLRHVLVIIPQRVSVS